MRTLLAFSSLLAFLLGAPATAGAQEAVVHAVFFYSPTCPHCHDVMDRDLPPLREKYGDRFRVIGVDVSSQGGQDLYQATVEHFGIPQSRLGVPTMIVGTEIMVGSMEIPQRLPGLIESGLAAGGIDWPPVEAVRQALAAQRVLGPRAPDAAAAPSAGLDTGSARGTNDPSLPAQDAPAVGSGFDAHLAPDSAIAFESPGMGDRFMRDPLGNGIAVATLLVLLVMLAWSVRAMLTPGPRAPTHPAWVFPALAVVGIGIAAYMSFVEVTGAEAVCGPVGDCNAVQQSPYAFLFGVIPVGLLGLAGYAALLAAWAVGTWGAEAVQHRGWLAAWGMAWVGTAFSAYLTFLEPFVIGATCAWCISSAVVMVLMLAVATRHASTAPPA